MIPLYLSSLFFISFFFFGYRSPFLRLWISLCECFFYAPSSYARPNDKNKTMCANESCYYLFLFVMRSRTRLPWIYLITCRLIFQFEMYSATRVPKSVLQIVGRRMQQRMQCGKTLRFYSFIFFLPKRQHGAIIHNSNIAKHTHT